MCVIERVFREHTIKDRKMEGNLLYVNETEILREQVVVNVKNVACVLKK